MAFWPGDIERERERERTKAEIGTLAVYLIAFIMFFGSFFAVTWAIAVQKARSYERVTGKKVSPWDALWLDLRVEEGAQGRSD